MSARSRRTTDSRPASPQLIQHQLEPALDSFEETLNEQEAGAGLCAGPLTGGSRFSALVMLYLVED